MTSKERIELAKQYGKEAFERGESGIPALNARMVALLDGVPVGGGIDPKRAFINAYTTALLAAPLPEIEE